MQGFTMWSPPGGAPIAAKSVVMNGLLGNFLKLFFHVRPASFYRMIMMSDVTQEYHLQSEHWYLYWITAFRPGAGSALMEDAIERMSGHDFYLENSNPPKNFDFYTKFGFQRLPDIGWHGCVVHPMLRKAQAR